MGVAAAGQKKHLLAMETGIYQVVLGNVYLTSHEIQLSLKERQMMDSCVSGGARCSIF